MTYIANPTIPCDALGMSKLTGFSNVYVAPNPVVDEMNVFINVASKQIANISIIDITGKTVTQMTVALNAGNNQSSVSTEGLSKGVYTLKISGEQQLFTQKIIKQ
jgi:hypothetical protein